FSVKTPLKVLVVTPDLDAVDASGATTVDVSGVKADAFHVRATGANHLHVTGTTKKLDVEASGASAVSAEGLPADAVTVHASGACSTEVTANKSLDAHASGASHVSFAGHPADVKKDATGASSISAK
ncbi:MAG TPA: DUF2807 domain-containing protein, partial [Minicystis sp.]|nr:DUF2807 domain-containing protein [Minicystis sp.]